MELFKKFLALFKGNSNKVDEQLVDIDDEAFIDDVFTAGWKYDKCCAGG